MTVMLHNCTTCISPLMDLMDLVGKLGTTKSGNQYICVMIDYFTKWTECEYILDFFCRFAAPQRILTDQVKEFVN